MLWEVAHRARWLARAPTQVGARASLHLVARLPDLLLALRFVGARCAASAPCSSARRFRVATSEAVHAPPTSIPDWRFMHRV